MPALYAHYHFGDKVINHLNPAIKKIIVENRQLFDIGVQGPDIFFYYQPLKSNPVSRFGINMHNENASSFFDKMHLVYARYNGNKDALMAYLLGFACHYSLDYIDHPYIAEYMKEANVSHFAIESDYDRHLMHQDGHFNSCVDKIIPSIENASVIQSCFKDFSIKEVQKAIKGIRDYNVILLSKSKIKFKSLFFIMKCIPFPELEDHLISPIKNPKCDKCNQHLDELEALAIKMFVEVSANLFAYLNGQSDLSSRFNHTFDELEVSEVFD